MPTGSSFPLYFLAVPLLVVLIMMVSDLSGRATVPAKQGRRLKAGRMLAWDIERLTRQIEVGSMASRDYYNSVLLEKLRGILVEKVCLETGMEREQVRDALKNGIFGPALLRDKELYRLLYTGAPVPGSGRVDLLEQAIVAIEAWKL